jgi:hypothetical protein
MSNTDKITYTSNALYRTGKSGHWANIVVLKSVIERIKLGDDISTTDLQKLKMAANNIYTSLDSGKKGDRKFDSDVVQFEYNLGKEAAKLGIPLSQNIADRWLRGIEWLHQDELDTKSAENAWLTNYVKNDYLEKGRNDAAQVITDAYELAENNPDFRSSLDAVFGQDFQSLSGDNSQSILLSNPDFKESLSESLDGNGSLKSEVDSIKEILNEKLILTIEEIKDAQAEAVENINSIAEQTAPIGQTASEVRTILAQIESQAKANEKQLRSEWNDLSLRSIATVASLLIGDKKTGRQLTAVVDAYIKTKNLFQQYNTLTATSTGAMSGIGAIGTLGLMCSYVGIATALYSAFTESDEPSADELILEGLQRLSEQIENFRLEVMDGLRVVDKKLSSFIEQTGENFQLLLNHINNVAIDVSGARISLANISIQLNQLWMDVDKKLDYLITEDFRETQTAVYNYKKDFGGEMTVEEFRFYIRKIRFYFEDSKNEIFAGDANSLDNSENLHTEIANKTAPECINVIREYAKRHINAEFVGIRCNPNRVDLCADMLVTMAREHPNTYKQVPSIPLFKEIYSEMKTNKSEVENLLTSGEKSPLTTLFEKLLTDYTESVENLVSVAREIRKAELIKNLQITNKDDECDIVKVLKVFADVISNGFKLDEWNVPVYVFNKHSIQKMCKIPIKHGEQDAWAEFYAYTEGPADFNAIPDHGTLDMEIIVRNAELRGKPDFSDLQLPEKITEIIFEKFPFVSIGVNTGIIQNNFKYYSTVHPSTLEHYQHAPVGANAILRGYAALFFKIEFNFGGDHAIIARPKLHDYSWLPYWSYIPPQDTPLLKLRDVISTYSLWNTSQNYLDENIHFRDGESDAANEKIATYIFDVLKNYSSQVQTRLFTDLQDPSSELFKATQKVETQAKLIKLFCQYIFRQIANLQTDRLSTVLGDLQTDSEMPSSSNGLFPLINNERLKKIISSFKFPDITDDPNDASRSCDFVDLQFLDKGLLEAVNDTTSLIAQEVVEIISFIENNDVVNEYLPINYIALEMILASQIE